MTENPMPSGLVIQGLSARIGDFTLEADFEVAAGERAVLTGRSGSGKTSLLRIIAGLDRADRGSILLGGADITRISPQARDIGVIFQEQALFPALSVLENAAFALRVRGVGREERDAQALPWLDRVGLKTRAHSGVANLSGGERQRVAFVRALLWKPKLLLLDEPFSALDRDLRTVLRSELVSLHKLWPVPLLLVTHDEADANVIATSRLVIEDNESAAIRRVVKSE